jgi:hypothetical protein
MQQKRPLHLCPFSFSVLPVSVLEHLCTDEGAYINMQSLHCTLLDYFFYFFMSSFIFLITYFFWLATSRLANTARVLLILSNNDTESEAWNWSTIFRNLLLECWLQLVGFASLNYLGP